VTPRAGLEFGATTLMFSNAHYHPVAGSRLYNDTWNTTFLLMSLRGRSSDYISTVGSLAASRRMVVNGPLHTAIQAELLCG
jgi:hypothetical protein